MKKSLKIVKEGLPTSTGELGLSTFFDGITYKSNSGALVNINNKSSLSPLSYSDVKIVLEDRGWNVVGRRYIKDGLLTIDKKEYKSIVSQYNPATFNTVNGTYLSEGCEEPITYLNDILEIEKIKIDMILKDETIYNSSKLSVDILDETVTFNMIESDEYTDTISLVGIKDRLNIQDCLVQLTVDYSDIENRIYKQDYSFNAIKEGKFNSVSCSISDYVDLEYLGGIIRVCAANSSIKECIISNCSITLNYG